MSVYVTTALAASLLGELEQRIREKIASGQYDAVALKRAHGGGTAGESYQIDVSSLPLPAQIRYWQLHGDMPHPEIDADLAGYGMRYGDAAISAVWKRQELVRDGMAIQAAGGTGTTKNIAALAAQHGIALNTLYTYIKKYKAQGLQGIMKATHRSDKGQQKSLCHAAYHIACAEYLDEKRRTAATIQEHLERERAKGSACCDKCYFNPSSDAREHIIENELEADYPECTQKKDGLKISEHRQSLSRILKTIPEQDRKFAREGARRFKDRYQYVGSREMPTVINAVWFADHHCLDVFVLNEHGEAVRPWVTAFMDAASRRIVGCTLCANPNSQTIMDALSFGIMPKMNNDAVGVPEWLYMDNGKDYKSNSFKGAERRRDLDMLSTSIKANEGLVQTVGIKTHYALGYNGRSKAQLERFFGTFEGKWIKEVPGYCSYSKDTRPDDVDAEVKAKKGLWTMGELYDYVVNTVFEEYHNRPHEGLNGRTPMEVYHELPKLERPLPSWSVLNIARRDRCKRMVRHDGIQFKNKLYWHDELMDHIGSEVVVMSSPTNLSSIGIVLGDRFLCEAPEKVYFKLLQEDPEVIADYARKQRGQLRRRKESIRRASRSVFNESADTSGKRVAPQVIALAYERAERARVATQEAGAARQTQEAAEQASANDSARSMFRALGEDVLHG